MPRKINSKKKPLVAIIVVNWNRKELTGKCLESLKMTSYPNYKLVLVDNGSTDGSIRYLKKIYPKMHILKLKENKGYTEGTNTGWEYALNKLGADYICAMDNDILTIQKEWLDLLIEEMEKSPKRGVGSGKHTFEDGRLQQPFFEADKKDHYKMDNGKYDFVKEVTGFCGPCILIKKEVIKNIGYYDENYFYGPNDADFCFRAKKNGYSLLYNGLSKSIHVGSVSGKSQNDVIFREQAYGMMLLEFRWGSIKEKIFMPLKQVFRAFFTRDNCNIGHHYKNLVFHKTFFRRLTYVFLAFFDALKGYKKVIKHKKDYEVIS